MTKVTDLITKIRYILTDSASLDEARGWSDNRILDLIDEAQRDICTEARIFKREYYVSLAEGFFSYNLPSDLISIDRVTDDERNVPTKSMSDLDAIDALWRTRTGDSIECVIQDSVNMNHLEIYPRPESGLTFVPFYEWENVDNNFTLVLNDLYGIVTETDQQTIIDAFGATESVKIASTSDFTPTNFGVVTEILNSLDVQDLSKPINVTVNGEVGVVGDVIVSEVQEFSEHFGGITSVSQNFGLLGKTWGIVASAAYSNAVLKVRYSAIPESLKFVDSSISLPDKWATAIKYYAAAYALLDDNDAKHNEKGILFEQKYHKELTKLLRLGATTDPTRSATSYRGLKRNKTLSEDY